MRIPIVRSTNESDGKALEPFEEAEEEYDSLGIQAAEDFIRKLEKAISADNHLHGGVNFALTWHTSKERLFW